MPTPIIVLCGPTATGKSAVAAEVARRLQSEVINADSMQVYKELNIGTGKPDSALTECVPHHGVDITTIRNHYSAAAFKRDMDPILDRLLAANRPPVVCGGTGLYLRALIDGMFPGATRDANLRETLHTRAADEGLSTLYAELVEVDPQSAERISSNDERRIVRALEVFHSTGTPISALQEERTAETARQHALWFGIEVTRDNLREAIARRVAQMFDAGWIGEVEALIEQGHAEAIRTLRPLGYVEILDAIDSQASDLRHTAEPLTTIHTQQFAKRQRTWFRHQHPVRWLAADVITAAITEAAQSYEPPVSTPSPDPR